MSERTRQRHEALVIALPQVQQDRHADATWLKRRTRRYAQVAGVHVEVILDAATYQRRTDRPADPTRAGEVSYHRRDGGLRARPLVFLNPDLLIDRATAERVIVHEIMHVRWPSYGHKPVAFRRAQTLIDKVAAASPH